MDWGGLLGSMALGGVVGYSEGALDEIHRDTAMEERRALFDMQKELRQMDIDAEDSRITRTQEFTKSENALTRDQSKSLTEGGWKHSEKLTESGYKHAEDLADKELSGRAGLLRLGDELKDDDYGKELQAKVRALKDAFPNMSEDMLAAMATGYKIKGDDKDDDLTENQKLTHLNNAKERYAKAKEDWDDGYREGGFMGRGAKEATNPMPPFAQWLESEEPGLFEAAYGKVKKGKGAEEDKEQESAGTKIVRNEAQARKAAKYAQDQDDPEAWVRANFHPSVVEQILDEM